MKKLLLLFGLFVALSPAQIAIYVISGPNLPANCSVAQGQIWFKTTGGAGVQGLYQCGPTNNSWQYVGSSGGTLVNSVTGTANQISCSPTTGSVVCSITNPLVVGSGPSSSWFTGTGSLLGLNQGTCTGTIPSGSDWLCDSSTGLLYGPSAGSFGPLVGLPSLADGTIWVGDGTNTAQSVFPYGDVTMNDAGIFAFNFNSSTCGLGCTLAIVGYDTSNIEALDLAVTGTGSTVVMSAGPTLTNPIVGTQSPGDNTTKAASTAFVTNGLSGKAASNASTTVNGQTCTLGSSCTVGNTGVTGPASWGMWNLTVPTSGGSWSWMNQGSASVSTGTHFLSILAPGQTSHNLRIYHQACPSGTWDMYAYGFITTDGGASMFGGFEVDDGTKIESFGTYSQGSNTTNYIFVNDWTNVTTSSANVASNQYPIVNMARWFRIQKTATNLTYYYSQDGVAWIQIYTATITNFLSAATNCGIWADPVSGSANPLAVDVFSFAFAAPTAQ